jgi:hypothetical protein
VDDSRPAVASVAEDEPENPHGRFSYFSKPQLPEFSM